MDKNTWIGFLLIAAIIVGFSLLNRPSAEERAERQRVQDSSRTTQQKDAGAQRPSEGNSAQIQETKVLPAGQEADTASQQTLQDRIAATYGAFAPAAQGEDRTTVLENSKIRLHIANRGGRIERAELKEYKAYGDTVNPLCLFRGDESSLTFILITANNHILSTDQLYFVPVMESSVPGNADDRQILTMRLKTDVEDAYIDFIYTMLPDDYMIDFVISPHNIQNVLAQNATPLEMKWRQMIPQHERGRKFEERYARLQYMLVGGDIEQLSESKNDSKRETARIRWIGYKDQFFSTVLIADAPLTSAEFESVPQDAYTRYVKQYETKASVDFDLTGQTTTAFRWYFGPNHYNTLKAYDDNLPSEMRLHLKELVPLGWKIVSWINKVLVIPMFDLFMGWGLHIGIVILLMTLVIKLIILPFVFASYRSSAKMRVLRPQIDEINAKYPQEKMQERQQATMALYRRAGVSPMSGCLPMLFQFPVLMAMFWFFPTAIELRGQSLWWAEDLSTYDAILTWNTPIFLFGDHLSLFCLIMTVANFGYTFITMQQQATDPNMKFMKWMMYLMPLMFLFIFNDYAAGLSYYYTISLGFTILQTMIFRWSIDDKKLLAQMEANAKKRDGQPKRSGLMARLERLQQEQQRMAREQAKQQAKKYR
ncbi:MAG: membrane protein insertase YidC [Paludibacteraceae bacterium]|nr:membrane protein insertase YidC [Paludibacteraceae bacterium]